MGDGCLCIFHSAIQALHAAKEIQLALKTGPQVPLRIGIHIGDIVIQEGNVYGDRVNLASRVESMGIPGAILLSSSVRNQIRSRNLNCKNWVALSLRMWNKPFNSLWISLIFCSFSFVSEFFKRCG